MNESGRVAPLWLAAPLGKGRSLQSRVALLWLAAPLGKGRSLQSRVALLQQ